MCAVISEDGVAGRRPRVGSYNAAHLIAFLEELNQVCRADGVTYVIVWDNVQFHHPLMEHLSLQYIIVFFFSFLSIFFLIWKTYVVIFLFHL